MKLKFRMYRRGRIYYVEDNETGQQESLKTSDKATATRLWNAKNEASILANSNLQVARAYMVASEPHMPKRTWKEVVDFIIQQKTGVNRHRWVSVSKHKPLARLWKWRVVDTRADQLLTLVSHRGLRIHEGGCSPLFSLMSQPQRAKVARLGEYLCQKATTVVGER